MDEMSMSGFDQSNPRKRASGGTNTTPPKKSNTSQSNETSSAPPPTYQRAPRACVHCRQHKLRCLGGDPCDRCVKSGQPCSFKHSTRYNGTRKTAEASLEPEGSSSAREPQRREPPLPSGQVITSRDSTLPTVDHPQERHDLASVMARQVQVLPTTTAYKSSLSLSGIISNSRHDDLPPPLYSRQIDPPRLDYPQPGISPELSAHQSDQTQTPSHSSIVAAGDVTSEKAVPASESLYEAPFRSLLVESRRNSFDNGQRPITPIRWNYQSSIFKADDDPINTGVLDQNAARILFDFYVEHCHPFLPIIDIASEDAFSVIRQSAPLFSAILAVSSRFYGGYNARQSQGSLRLGSTVLQQLANLAEAHLANTLLRRHLGQTDVQASLLLAAWNLQHEGTTGPDAWVVTGHAARISRRLGVHKILAHAAETARSTQRGSVEWHQLEQSMPSWRTWLCWFTFDGFLSLGHGRPQSTQFETVDESGFLRIRLEQSPLWPKSHAARSLHGDVYIASQVQLTQIARDLINWSEMLADPGKAVYADPRRANMYTGEMLSFANMSKNLNQRLDDWARLWIWPNSTYGSYLGASSRVARLQLEHLRLCLNASALTSRSEGDDDIARCLRFAATAATRTIQLHSESTQTDFGLSFASDYLTTALAHAAVYLIRLSDAPKAVLAASRVEVAVLEHYIQMALEVLQSADLSEIGLGRYLAKRVRVRRQRMAEERQQVTNSNAPTSNLDEQTRLIDAFAALDQGQWGDSLNFEAFFQEPGEFDINCLLDPPARQNTDDFFSVATWGDSTYQPTDNASLDHTSLFE